MTGGLDGTGTLSHAVAAADARRRGRFANGPCWRHVTSVCPSPEKRPGTRPGQLIREAKRLGKIPGVAPRTGEARCRDFANSRVAQSDRHAALQHVGLAVPFARAPPWRSCHMADAIGARERLERGSACRSYRADLLRWLAAGALVDRSVLIRRRGRRLGGRRPAGPADRPRARRAPALWLASPSPRRRPASAVPSRSPGSRASVRFGA